MANNKLSVLKFLEQSYDIDALFLGGVAADKFARIDTENSFTVKNTFSAGVKISGRLSGAGDDEGLVIGRAVNNYAGVCLGEPAGVRSVFYLKPDNSAIWRYNSGTDNFDIYHPAKAGTIALTSDIPTKVSQLTNDSGYGTVTKVDNVSPSSGNVSLSAVRFVSQTLTDAQKTQARTNIGAASSTHTHKDSEVLLYTNSQATTPYATLQEWTSAMNSISSLVTDYLGNTMFQPHDHSAYNIALLDDQDIPYNDLQSFHNQVKDFMASSGGGSSSAYTTLDRDFYLDFNNGYFRYADNHETIPFSNGYEGVDWDSDNGVFGWVMEWFRRDVFKIPTVVNNSMPYEAQQIAARGRCLFPSPYYFSEPSMPWMVISNILWEAFSISADNWDSMVVECLGGPGSSAECTMTIDIYTRTAEHYRLQVASTTDGGATTGEYVTKGVQRIDNKIGSSDETIKDIKVVSSLPSNPDPKTLYIVV